MADICKKRSHTEPYEPCGRPDATYGVTIPFNIAEGKTYSIMVCKRHFDEYLSNPQKFISEHEVGALNWLLGELENFEPIG